MITFLSSALIAAVFAASALLALSGKALPARSRPMTIAVAAGVLLALAFGDLFPESIELGGALAIAGFISAFAVLFLIEALTHAHTHHASDQPIGAHAYLPFLVGLAIHNVADGFAVGISTRLAEGTAVTVGVGVLVHQVPVGLSFATVLAATHIPRRSIMYAAVVLAACIPLATAITIVTPPLSDPMLGVLIGIAAGILAYVSTAHLLPEAQNEHPGTTTGIVFASTLLIMTTLTLTVLAE